MYRWAIRHPRSVVIVAWVVVALFLPGLWQLKLDTRARSLLSAEHPVARVDAKIRQRFDLQDVLVVALESLHPEGVWRLDYWQHLRDLTRALARLPETDASEVISLATETGGQVRPGTLEFEPLLEHLPSDLEQLDRLRAELFSLQIYHGTLIATAPQAAGDSGNSSAWCPTAATILIGCSSITDNEVDTVPSSRTSASTSPRVSRAQLVTAIRQLLDDNPLEGVECHFVGAALAEELLGQHIAIDLARLIPLVLLVMALLFAIVFRRVIAVALPLMEVGAALIVVFGALGYLGVPIHLPLSVLPVILCAAGLADEIHILTHYRRLQRRGVPLRATTLRTLSELFAPISRTSLTTALAFLSFVGSDIAPLQHFGMAAALGIGCCWAWSVLVVPAVLTLTTLEWPRAPSPKSLMPESIERAGKSKWRLAAVTTIILGIGAYGTHQLQVQDSWEENFSPASEFRKSTQRVNELFAGVHQLHVQVDASAASPLGEIVDVSFVGRGTIDEYQLEPERPVPVGAPVVICAIADSSAAIDASSIPTLSLTQAWDSRHLLLGANVTSIRADGSAILRPIKDRWYQRQRLGEFKFVPINAPFLHPSMLEATSSLEQQLLQPRWEVGATMGPAQQIAFAAFLRGGKRADDRHWRDTPRENLELLVSLGDIRGVHRRREVVTDDANCGLITVFLKNANYRSTEQLLNRLATLSREQLQPQGIEVSVAGDVAVSQGMIGSLVKTQIRSIILSLLVVGVVAGWLLRSWRFGFLCLLPPVLGVWMNFGLMGLLQVPLGIATSMFSCMVIGIGADFSMHVVCRYISLREQQQTHPGRKALQQVAPAIAIDTCALTLGFAVLLVSTVPSTRNLGWLVGMSLLTCSTTSLLWCTALLCRTTDVDE